MHKDSINLFLHLVAAVVLVYSLWMRSPTWILISVLIAVLGHIIEEINKKREMKATRREMPKAKRKRKKGALEMSIGTIVIMVIAVTMLILGIVFVRSIMCSGIQMTEDLSKGTRDEINKLFGADKNGVRCAGEGTVEPVTFGSGGTRNLICVIKTEDNVEYDLVIQSIVNLKDKEDTSFEGWILKRDGWSGWVDPGGAGTDAVVAVLDIPSEVSSTNLEFVIESTNKETNVKKTHHAFVNIEPVGFVTGAMC